MALSEDDGRRFDVTEPPEHHLDYNSFQSFAKFDEEFHLLSKPCIRPAEVCKALFSVQYVVDKAYDRMGQLTAG